MTSVTLTVVLEAFVVGFVEIDRLLSSLDGSIFAVYNNGGAETLDKFDRLVESPLPLIISTFFPSSSLTVALVDGICFVVVERLPCTVAVVLSVVVDCAVVVVVVVGSSVGAAVVVVVVFAVVVVVVFVVVNGWSRNSMT